ncbi:MAG TPA: hypothetical protein VG167_04705 [Verrucomicrobiae bacterium]|nr:hypothetical protein [Verrucomicrobiae bacterium]
MRRAFARFLVVLSGAVALALVLLVVMTLRQPPPTPSAFPNPNGYDAFVKAAWLLPSAISDFRALPPPELRALLASNSISLNLVRTGLAAPVWLANAACLWYSLLTCLTERIWRF